MYKKLTLKMFSTCIMSYGKFSYIVHFYGKKLVQKFFDAKYSHDGNWCWYSEY